MVTDGIVDFPDVTVMDSLLSQLRSHTISVSFIRVGYSAAGNPIGSDFGYLCNVSKCGSSVHETFCSGWSIDSLIDWFIDPRVDKLIDCAIDWLIEDIFCWINWLIDWFPVDYWLTDIRQEIRLDFGSFRDSFGERAFRLRKNHQYRVEEISSSNATNFENKNKLLSESYFKLEIEQRN